MKQLERSMKILNFFITLTVLLCTTILETKGISQKYIASYTHRHLCPSCSCLSCMDIDSIQLLATTVILLSSMNVSINNAGAYVGFGESDYHEIEGTKYVDIVVQKHGVNTDSVILTLTSKLIHELPQENGDGMDPAECKIIPSI